MAVKHYTITKKIGEVEYTAQFNGLSAAQQAIDSCYIDGSSNISTVKLTEYLFRNVIVVPKGLTADDFETIDELNAVTTFARRVMQGEFRKEALEGAASK